MLVAGWRNLALPRDGNWGLKTFHRRRLDIYKKLWQAYIAGNSSARVRILSLQF